MASRVVEILAGKRAELGLSMEQVAERAGLHRTTVGLIERQRRGVTLEVALRLAWALETNLHTVLCEIEGQP